jgi:hypothetical protein
VHLQRAADFMAQGSTSVRGNIVWRSLAPLPSRTVISRRSKSTSFTRNRSASIKRMPVP